MTPEPTMFHGPTAWLSLPRAAKYAELSEATLRRAIKAGALRAFRVNNARLLRFRTKDLDAYLSASVVEGRSS